VKQAKNLDRLLLDVAGQLASIPLSGPFLGHFAFTKLKSILMFCHALSTSFDIVIG
jgi:hypothetical protein